MSQKVYEAVTRQILAKVQETGLLPWQRPWHLSETPMNFVSRKAYKGFNVFALTSMGYKSPYWVTFKQARFLGGTVKKGEKSSPVVFWNFRESDEEEIRNGKKKKKTIPMARYYQVFNLEQTEGIEIPDDAKLGPVLTEPLNAEALQAALAYLGREGITLDHGGDRAFYAPKLDLVKMPLQSAFHSAEAYHSTLFHELAHSTGIERRLNRGLDTETNHFGSERYSKEELVAEFGASFLCAEFNLFSPKVEEQSAAYLKSWSKFIKDNPSMFVSAANQAQKAADFIRNRNQEAADEAEED